jgi:hypothetical protein
VRAMHRSDLTAPDYIDQASTLLRAAETAHRQDERIRLLQDVETLLQMAKQQLTDIRAKLDSDVPDR